MSKDSAIQKLFELEASFPVENIKVNGIHFWPVLRIYLGSNLAYNKDTRVSASSALKLTNFFSVFYGFWNLFRSWNFFGLSSSDQRKNIDGKWLDKIDFVNEYFGKGLIMELPNPRHKSRSQLGNARVMSKILLYAKGVFAERFVSVKIEGQDIIDKIKKELDVSIDERSIARRFLGQRVIARWIIRLKKPKALFLTTPYTNFGYVYEFRESGRKVVEFQHGAINAGHFAYQLKNRFDDKLYPNYLLTTGILEKEALKDSVYVESDKIIPVGSFYIDHVSTREIDASELEKERKKYNKIVCVSAQDRLEEKYIPFLKEIATKEPEIGFWLLPRFRSVSYYDQYNLPQNVFFKTNFNTHEAIILSDFHSTINSTTAIESLALGTRNILMNVDDLSTAFFSEMLKDKELTYFARSAEDFIEFLKSCPPMSRQEVQNRQNGLIKLNFKDNLQEFVKEMGHA